MKYPAQPPLNPFLAGKPVPPDRFIGRTSEVHAIFSRITYAQSTAIVGEPHIGKSSLKRFIGDDRIRSEWLGEKANRTIFVDIDCHLFPGDLIIDSFWRNVLLEIEPKVDAGPLKER